MNEKELLSLGKYIDRARNVKNLSEFEALASEFPELSGISENDGSGLAEKVMSLLAELAELKEELLLHSENKALALSDSEKEAMQKVERLLLNNLFTYHFQPIVRADSGKIYGYEALMRAAETPEITPFHILKYAELTNRLGTVEEYTFLNVLRLIGKLKERLGGKPVFINSLPDIRMEPEKEKQIEAMLGEHRGQVVIEITESSQFSENHLAEIKEKFTSLGIPIAVDDYGTGYSNISNLLRYTPNYVKIDRSLMSGIQDDQNKKHFVREIIDFCHDNGILALAEGIETSEELRCVILLGVDLIQGFYTARPAPELLEAIPYVIRSEIRTIRQEREDGRALKIYRAEDGERVFLDKLQRDGFSRIIIGSGYSQGTVTVSGSPSMDTGIHLETSEGFNGRIILESVHLSNLIDRPCIDIGAGSSVEIMLIGDNKLKTSGIRVPETSRLTLEGSGNIDIELGSSDYYGIGNDMRSANGELIFDLDGTVSITAESHSGVCIGSGLGGMICVRRGRYVLKAEGGIHVGMGAMTGDANVDITGCDFEAVASGAFCTGIGSIYGDADIHLLFSSLKCNLSGQMTSSFGTIHGQNASIRAESVNIHSSANADEVTGFGSLFYSSNIHISRSSVNIKSDGTNALALGGLSGSTQLSLTDVDFSAKLASTLRVCIIAEEKDIHTVGGRYRVKMGDSEYERLVY